MLRDRNWRIRYTPEDDDLGRLQLAGFGSNRAIRIRAMGTSFRREEKELFARLDRESMHKLPTNSTC